MMKISQQCNGQAGANRQRGMTVIGMLLLIIVIAFIALIGMKVVPMYIQYYSIKSTVESLSLIHICYKLSIKPPRPTAAGASLIGPTGLALT